MPNGTLSIERFVDDIQIRCVNCRERIHIALVNLNTNVVVYSETHNCPQILSNKSRGRKKFVSVHPYITYECLDCGCKMGSLVIGTHDCDISMITPITFEETQK